jgi:hypothetical protein
LGSLIIQALLELCFSTAKIPLLHSSYALA